MLRHLLSTAGRSGSRTFNGTPIAPPKLSLLRVPRAADIEFRRSNFSKRNSGIRSLPKRKEDYTTQEWIIDFYEAIHQTPPVSIVSAKKTCPFEEHFRRIHLYYSSPPVSEISATRSTIEKQNGEAKDSDSKSNQISGSDWFIGLGLVSILWLSSIGIAVLMDRFFAHRKGSSANTPLTADHKPLTIVEKNIDSGKTYSISNHFTARVPHLSKTPKGLKESEKVLNPQGINVVQSDNGTWNISYTVTRNSIEDVIKAEKEMRKVAEEEIATLNSLEKLFKWTDGFFGALVLHANSIAPPQFSLQKVPRSGDIELRRSTFSNSESGIRRLPKKKEDYTIEEWIIAYYDAVPNTTETSSVASIKKNCTFEDWIRLYYSSAPISEISTDAPTKWKQEDETNSLVRDSKSTDGSGSNWINGAWAASILWLTSLGIVVFMERYLSQRKNSSSGSQTLPSLSPDEWIGHTSKALINLPYGPLTIVEKHTTNGMTYSISNHFQARLAQPSDDDDSFEMFCDELNSLGVTLTQSAFDSSIWDISYTVTRPTIIEAIEAEKEVRKNVMVQIMTQHVLEKGLIEGVKLLVKAKKDFRKI